MTDQDKLYSKYLDELIELKIKYLKLGLKNIPLKELEQDGKEE